MDNKTSYVPAILWTLFVCAVIFIPLGYYFGYQHNSTTTSVTATPTAEATVSTTVTATPASTVDTSGWQSYTSTLDGFTIQYPATWTEAVSGTKTYFGLASDRNYYVDKYSGTLDQATTELRSRIQSQFGNACGGPQVTYSTTDVNKFGTTAKQVMATWKTIDCQDGKIVSNTSYDIVQKAYVVTSTKGTLLIWNQETNTMWTGDTKAAGDLANSVIDTITLQ